MSKAFNPRANRNRRNGSGIGPRPLPAERRSERRTNMVAIKDAAAAFLANKRIAVTGVSRNPKGHGSNVVYKRLRDRHYQVYAVNPNADQVEGDRCYHALKDIPGGLDAVVIATRPEVAAATMRESAE